MRSIVEAGTGLDVRAVVSNRPDAAGLEWARSQGISTRVVDHKQFGAREEFDRSLAAVIDEHAPQIILLAGFMRIFTEGFIRKYPRRIVNIHPSLLPAFPGMHTHRQALDAGVKVHGATVHVVTAALDNGPVIIQGTVPVIAGDTEEALAAGVKVHGATVHVVTTALDSGPVVVQATVPVMANDTEETLAGRVLGVEHRIYPQAVRWFVEGRIEFAAGNVVQVRGTGVPGDTMISPRNIE